MEKLNFISELRTEMTKGTMKKMRAGGKIPAVLYGNNENINLFIDSKSFREMLKKSGRNVLINMKIEKAEKPADRTVILKEIQRNPVTRDIIHVDFYQLDRTKKIEVAIPIHFVGEAPGVKEGGVLNHVLRELKVECLPASIPDKIIVDVSHLQLGDSISIADLTLAEGVELAMLSDLIIANVVKPTVWEEV